MRGSKLLFFGLLLGLSLTTWGASLSDPRKPLRYPFGLKPDTTAQQIQAVLASKGLKRASEKDVGLTHLTSWRMSGQIAYEDFKPGIAILTQNGQKLSSLRLEEEAIPSCAEAQTAYLSALAFVRENYVINDHNELTREPALDALDCGPHFKSEDYELQLTGKVFVISVAPTVRDGRYTVAVTYHWVGLLKPDQNEKEIEQKKRHDVQENL